MASIEDIEARRAERKAALKAQELEQVAIDLEAIDVLEVEHGDSNVSVVGVPFTPGLVARVAVRTPTTHETKRYQDRIRPRGSEAKVGDSIAATSEIGKACVIYPKGDAFAALIDARPGLPTQLGMAALELGRGKAESEGKD